ncbi:Inositol polyphosphate-related phosphatase [Ophiocordyceps camponoti-floridani]|uniref:Inositol polyphosphate-related phosphatase n=1 Tax=Ophiocordyceps camponoti-floridani TaxID=2030778 RepID=A0A8H4Q8P8_9HYPO|nr:Inositol polyphosphate-related phosphatase [Ophiocordyceps camponoti-floridani]
MDHSPAEDGPDGSSIKPVSSLLARFENMNTGSHQHEQSRSLSPAPKPERLRNFKPAGHDPPKTPARPPVRPPDRLVAERTGNSRPPSRPSPTIKPLGLALQPPAVMIQPPPSSPDIAPSVADHHSPFLDPDPEPNRDGLPAPSKTIKTPTPSTSPFAPSIKPPRQSLSNPPSPPPPRRSVDARREFKQAPPPPPAPRSSRGRPTSNLPEARDGAPSKADISQAVSPFNSPPGSPTQGHVEPIRELPMRLTAKSKTDGAGLEDPPPRPSTASRPTTATSSARSHGPSPRIADLRLTTDSSRFRGAHDHEDASSKPPQTTPLTNSHNFEPPPPPPDRPVSQPAPRQVPPPPARQTKDSRTRDQTPNGEGLEIRRSSSPNTAASSGHPAVAPAAEAGSKTTTAFPDGSNSNRRPPFIRKGCGEIQTRYDARALDSCGELVCTSGQLTRVWNLVDGEQIMSLAHTEGVRATSVAFKPAPSADTEGSTLWIGTNLGEIMEVDVASQRVVHSKAGLHGRCDVMRIYRHVNELWTLDDMGLLLTWGPGADGVPSLASHPQQSNKVPRGHTFSMVVGNELWHATGKAIRVFAPSSDRSGPFQVLVRPLTFEGAGDVTAGTLMRTQPNKAFLGHIDGKVSIFSTEDYSCLAVLSISSWKINALAGVGQHLWAGYNTGRMCVYDLSTSPWTVRKDWQGHDQSIIKMGADPAAAYRLDRLQVVSLGTDNKIKAWDGLMQDDWLEEDMKSKDVDYCDFDELRATVMTWNAGASTPHSLRYSDSDSSFFQDLVRSSGSPDMFIFGFQELVDLEDKTATARRFLKGKKKEGTDQERMSHQYRDWRDFLIKTLDDYVPADDLYHLLQSAPLVGLFTCVFVKASLRERIRNVCAAEVKRGMGGLHGNKGAVVVRFQVDDTSLCFINCHLAAGQSQSSSRHNDVAAILDTTLFPAERDAEARIDSFAGGGDGTMIMDHELCVLNGDLNYRIDTMSRDTVVKAVSQGNLAKLLERDQLLMARRRNPAFRLRAFEEMAITFAPTYKYDVGTDTYDTSEKRRSPAWCDRLLCRGRGRIQQLDYQRHEVRVSDHRPVTGSFRLWVKKVDARGRAVAWMESQQRFEDVRQRETDDEQISYLVNTCGYDEESSDRFVRERSGRKGSTRR